MAVMKDAREKTEKRIAKSWTSASQFPKEGVLLREPKSEGGDASMGGRRRRKK